MCCWWDIDRQFHGIESGSVQPKRHWVDSLSCIMPRRRKNGDNKQANPASSSRDAAASSSRSSYSPPRAFEQGEPPLIKPNILNIFGSSLRPSRKTPGAFSSHARASTAKDDGPPECYRDECATSIVFLPYSRPTIYKRCPLPPPPSYKTTKSGASAGQL